MKPFLHASCCAYKLLWSCCECNYMKVKSRKYVCDADHMVQNTEKNYCKLQFIWENEFN